MRHPRIIIASISLAAAAAIGGGITAAAATTSTSHASSRPAASQHAAATVRTVQATVGGKTETILVNSQGLPLYYYLSDTAAKSVVTGGLAALWPPLTSASPAATGLTGKLAAVMDIHGDQVAYNGHLLYTFADDQAGQVTGQGVQGFFVATPGLTPIAGLLGIGRYGPGRFVRQRLRLLRRPGVPVCWLRSSGRCQRPGPRTQDPGQADMTITRLASAGRKHVARMAAASVALASVAALAVAGVAERSAVTALFTVLGHLHWLWIPAGLLLETASMAAFAIMLRRLLAAGGASVGIRPMLATAYAANAVSVSVPLAGPALATAFTFRRFTRQGADAPLAAGRCWPGGWSCSGCGVRRPAAVPVLRPAAPRNRTPPWPLTYAPRAYAPRAYAPRAYVPRAYAPRAYAPRARQPGWVRTSWSCCTDSPARPPTGSWSPDGCPSRSTPSPPTGRDTAPAGFRRRLRRERPRRTPRPGLARHRARGARGALLRRRGGAVGGEPGARPGGGGRPARERRPGMRDRLGQAARRTRRRPAVRAGGLAADAMDGAGPADPDRPAAWPPAAAGRTRQLAGLGPGGPRTPPAMAHLPDRATRPAARTRRAGARSSRRSGRRFSCLPTPRTPWFPSKPPADWPAPCRMLACNSSRARVITCPDELQRSSPMRSWRSWPRPRSPPSRPLSQR